MNWQAASKKGGEAERLPVDGTVVVEYPAGVHASNAGVLTMLRLGLESCLFKRYAAARMPLLA